MVQYMQVLKSYTDLSIGRSLSGNAQLLYFRLFLMNNRAGWSDIFQTSNNRLMLEMGISSKQTFERARKELVDKGFIKYISGTNKQPSIYSLLPLSTEYSQSKSANGTVNVPQTGEQTGEQTGRIIDNYIHKDKNPQKAAAAMRGRAREGSSPDCENKNQAVDTPYAQVTGLYDANIHRITSEIEQQALNDLVDTYGVEWCLAAIEEAAEGHAHSVKYVRAILERWKRDGFRSPRPQTQPQNSQVVPLPARRMPPQPAQRKLLGIDGLRAMWEAEKK